MLAEVAHVARKFVPSVGGDNRIVVVLITLVSLSLIFVVGYYGRALSALIPYFVAPLIAMLIIPFLTHRAVAGERQARSLEALLAAPVTSYQIIVAKTIRACIPAVIIGFFMVAMSIAMTMGLGLPSNSSFTLADPVEPILYAIGAVVYGSLAWATIGISIGVSSYFKTSSAALLSIFIVLIVSYVFVPIVFAGLLGVVSDSWELIALHPYLYFVTAQDASYPGSTDSGAIHVMGFSGIMGQIIIGYLGMMGAVRTLDRVRAKGET